MRRPPTTSLPPDPPALPILVVGSTGRFQHTGWEIGNGDGNEGSEGEGRGKSTMTRTYGNFTYEYIGSSTWAAINSAGVRLEAEGEDSNCITRKIDDWWCEQSDADQLEEAADEAAGGVVGPARLSLTRSKAAVRRMEELV